MIKKFYLLTSLLLLCTNLTLSQPGWNMQYSTEIEFPNCIAFADSNIGVITGFNYVSYTSDGGNFWISSLLGSSFNYSSAQFVNHNTGFLWASQHRGLFKTTNNGINWSRINSVFSLAAFYFLNSDLGYFSEPNGNVNRTTDGGMTWQTIVNNHSIIPVSIGFATEKFGMLIDRTGRGLSTTDGGISWFDIFLSTGYGGKISYPDSSTVYVASNSQSGINTIRKSTNNGLTWTSVYFYTSIFTDIQFVNANTGTVSGNVDMLMRTTNGGATWIHQTTGGQLSAVNAIFFLNENTGWLINSDGIVYKTTDGGGIMTGVSNNIENLNEYSLSQNFPNPFNPVTKIKISVPHNAENVKLIVFDISGREMQKLIDEKLTGGTYEISWNGTQFTSGIYFYRLVSGNNSETRKMILLK